MRKKSQGLPVNIIVMMIIGIMLFSLSLFVFKKFASGSEKKVEDLELEIKNNIAELECDNDQYICAPVINTKQGKLEVSQIFITNIGDEGRFKLSIKVGETSHDSTGEYELSNDECGKIKISFLGFHDTIKSGNSASIPIAINTNLVSKAPCSFVFIASVEKDGNEVVGKTPVIVNVY